VQVWRETVVCSPVLAVYHRGSIRGTAREEPTMAATYDLKHGANGEKYRFNLKAANGEVVLVSESYESKENALNCIESVKENARHDDRFERKNSKRSEPYFVLKAANGQIIGFSEMYSSEAACENGIASVKKNGPLAQLRDHTTH
jgi:uncharacterized protein YegP (UPF0339 family)